MLTNLSLVSVPLFGVLLTAITISFPILSRSSKASSIFLSFPLFLSGYSSSIQFQLLGRAHG